VTTQVNKQAEGKTFRLRSSLLIAQSLWLRFACPGKYPARVGGGYSEENTIVKEVKIRR